MHVSSLTKLVPAVAALLVAMPAFGAGHAAIVPVTTAEPAAADTFLTQLLDGSAPGLSAEAPVLERLMPAGSTASPVAVRSFIGETQAAFDGVSTPQDAILARAALTGLALDRLAPTANPAPLAAQVLRSYAMLDLVPTAQQVLDLQASAAALPAGDAHGLAILMDAANRAIVLQGGSNEASATEAALLLLDASDLAKPFFQSASVSAACGVPFEDPLLLVWLGTPCNDTLGNEAARLLSVDPGGDDTYTGNAGGALASGLIQGTGLVDFTFTSERSILEVTSNVTIRPWHPKVSTNPFTYPDSLDPDGLNATVTDVLDNGTQANIINNNTDAPEDEAAFLQEFVGGLACKCGPNATNDRRYVPVALALDFAGNDVYSSDSPGVQGANAGTVGGVGVLWDEAGDDSYSCHDGCQGYSSAGIGLLADSAGTDSFSGNSFTQGVADGGYLLDFGGSDHYTSTGVGAQGSHYNGLAPHLVPSVLLDTEGDDVYVGDILAQGAGGLLLDQSGNDQYTSRLDSQGTGYAETLGLLLDESGTDQYSAYGTSQGFGATGVGLLADLSGDDTYSAQHDGQGIAVGPGGFGLLLDQQGDDAYASQFVGQGRAASSGVGVLADESGDDTYTVAGSGQGVSYVTAGAGEVGGGIGILVDADGDDDYTAGDHSQGSGGVTTGIGLLLDGYGTDHYVAGASSQGSGGSDKGIENHAVDFILVGGPQADRALQGGVGVLLDSTQDQASVETDTSNDPGEVSSSVTITSPPAGPATADSYQAGDYSQGSSGIGGGIGLLLDRADKGGLVSTFTAGDYSQGAAHNGGLGLLDNADGKDHYTAGAHSQGSSDGGLGVLLDESGNDEYTPTDVATSHGYGNSTLFPASTTNAALGLLLDDAGNDGHPDLGDNECLAKGDAGLAVDTEGLSVPAGCLDQIVTAVNDTVSELIAALTNFVSPPGPLPPTGTVYFFDNMEDSTVSGGLWTTDARSNVADCNAASTAETDPGTLPDEPVAPTSWRLRNETTDPQVSPNAASGTQYWYVGLPVGAPAEGYTGCTTANLNTTDIDLTSATNPSLSAWIGGSSETDFDFLRVFVYDTTAGTSTMVEEISGPDATVNPTPAYVHYTADLSAFAGHHVKVGFQFASDPINEPGQGFNVDDVAVYE